VTKPRVRAILLCTCIFVAFVVLASTAAAQTATPSPTATATTSPEVRAGNAIFGLIILTAFAAAGYYVAKWIRRDRRPRPPGPWFGGRLGRDR
jgi:hypothetical protein